MSEVRNQKSAEQSMFNFNSQQIKQYRVASEDLKLPFELYLDWVKLMNFLLGFIPKKMNVKWRQEGNSLYWNDFEVGCEFINAEHLRLCVKKKGEFLNRLELAVQISEENDFFIIGGHVLMVLSSKY